MYFNGWHGVVLGAGRLIAGGCSGVVDDAERSGDHVGGYVQKRQDEHGQDDEEGQHPTRACDGVDPGAWLIEPKMFEVPFPEQSWDI